MWLDLIEQKDILKNIFRDDIVTLNNVTIRKIEIDCTNGWIFRVHLDLQEFPSKPPLKWVQNNYNVVQIGFDFVENQILTFQNEDMELMKGNVYFEEDENVKIITFKNAKNDDIIFQLKCKWVLISSLIGYMK